MGQTGSGASSAAPFDGGEVMSLSRAILRMATRVALLAVVLSVAFLPASAQNKKKSWEIFIYFGGFFGNEIPSATQTGVALTYRTDPLLALNSDPTDINSVFVPNLGRVGGDQTSMGVNDPNYTYPFEPQATAPFQFNQPPCSGDFSSLDPNGDFRTPYFDECDGDQESRWVYNASGIARALTPQT